MKREIELVLLKLVDGGRVLRFSEPHSGLCLEKRLDPDETVARQKRDGRKFSLQCWNASWAPLVEAAICFVRESVRRSFPAA